MIEKIIYDSNTYALVFTESIPEYRELMLIAASDNSHKLKENYKKDILSKQTFMTIFMINEIPTTMFGLFHEDWMNNAARGFNRFYKPPHVREGSETGKFQWKVNNQRITNFYHDNPIHKNFGIDSIFITRNFHNSRKDALLRKRFNDEWKTSFEEYPEILMYKGVPQRFYVWGNNDFLKTLPVHVSDEHSIT